MFKYLKISCLAFFISCATPPFFAQNTPGPIPLDWATFRQEVLARHPAAIQANLQYDQAKAYLLKSHGGFDPKAYGDFYGKNFNGKTYFTYNEAGVKLPTRLGIELKGAFNQTGGQYLDPESKLPKNGQASVGFTWSLGQGLLFDERRADLSKAKIGLRAAEAARRAALNELLLQAAKAYWGWVLAENQYRLYEATLRQAELRLEGWRENVLQGDKPAIDTIELLLQVQTRQMDLNFARVERQNSALDLANFLWVNETTPLSPTQLPAAPELLTLTVPSRWSKDSGDELRQRASVNHPDLLLYDAKLQSLVVDRRLKNELRKPTVDLSYFLLGNAWEFFPTPAPDGGAGVLANNVKYGLSISYPLLNRKARGDWQLAQLKIRDAELGLEQKKQIVDTKVQQYFNELDNYNNQIRLFGQVSANYRVLLDAELEKFRFGESSVFLINTREQRWLDAQLKYQKLIAEFYKTEAGLLWAAGVLAE